jgi:hypothetical protein
MKVVLTALGIIAFAATMAVAKTGKFHTPVETATAKVSYTQWHRSLADPDRYSHGSGAIGG